MKQILYALWLGVCGWAATPAWAQECANQAIYIGAPEIKAALKKNFVQLCNTRYTVGYSGVSRTGVWAAEHLSREDVLAARELEREGNFHEDARLPSAWRARLGDYRNSGYDRGHLTPNGDTTDRQSQSESFLLSNIVPQYPQNNRRLWATLEKHTRTLAITSGDIYVVTGGALTGAQVKFIGQSPVIVPDIMWKAVYSPTLHKAGAFVAPNDDTQRGEFVSIQALAALTGVNPFPWLDAATSKEAFKW